MNKFYSCACYSVYYNKHISNCPTEVISLLHGIQFQVKLTFGLKRNDKKTKNFEMLVKAC
jgi:hypothetical protein